MSNTSRNWLLVTHLDTNGQGTLNSIRTDGKKFIISPLTSPSSSEKTQLPWFLGLQSDGHVIMFDPETRTINIEKKMPKDAYPAYSYKDTLNNRIWFMNDGDKENGNDALNCGDNGSTVTIFDLGDGKKPPQHLKTLCVGRGHHVTTFIEPTAEFPDLPKVAYVSNLLDGSICVVGNDSNTESYLRITHTINLCETEKEKTDTRGIPNNAFPHGKQFSHHTGKVYSLNNGYGTVAVIDPHTHQIGTRINLKGCSNLLLSPCGKFLIGKGADRKSNASHVLGRLNVIDVVSHEILTQEDIADFYPSTYRFGPNGKKLYVTSAATGKDTQKENLKTDSLYIYDANALPKLSLIKMMNVGNADCGRRPIAFTCDKTGHYVFISNPTDATVTILNGEDDRLIDTISIAKNGGNEFNFSFWQNSIYGA